ncbi:MAG: ABC transporter ATP-binding protein/permease [Polyangiaceae bacterium]|nr:ABC transporter ATP-binding protein/permease [Polyangiaceae bacterium]
MIRSLTSLFTVATDLAQTSDPRLPRGIARGAVEALFGAVPYAGLYLLLRDLLAGHVDPARTAFLVALMFLGLALQIWLGVGAMIDVMTSSYSLFGAARLRVADHIRKLPMGWFSSSRSGTLAGVLTTEMNLLSEIWSHFIAYLSGGLAIPLFVGLFLLAVDPRLGLVMMATLPLAALLLAVSMRILGRATGRLLGVIEDSNQAILEYIRGIQVLRTLGRFGQGYQRLDQALIRLRRETLRVELLPTPFLGAYGFSVEAGFSLLVLVGAWMVAHGSLSSDVFLLFIVVSIKFFNPLFDLGTSLLLLRFGKQALERTRGVLETPTLPQLERSRALPQGSSIRMVEVEFSHEGSSRPTLQGVSLELEPGTLTALVGPSGSGKSTLVHLLARLWDVNRGRIELGGVDLRDLSEQDLHRRVALVSQDVVLFSGSIRDNIRIGKADASEDEILLAARRAQAHEFICSLPRGYDTQVGEGGSHLSGGERQRISIARALLKDADVILFDEATASVDPSAEAAIQQAIDELIAGKTVVVIAHRLRTIQRAHRILVLDQGRLVEQGDHPSLLARQGVYARLWNAQQTPEISP